MCKFIGIVGYWDSPKVYLRITEMDENRKIRMLEKRMCEIEMRDSVN